jgi:hypothetical protein
MLEESERVENSAETARFSASWDSRVWRAEMVVWSSVKGTLERCQRYLGQLNAGSHGLDTGLVPS